MESRVEGVEFTEARGPWPTRAEAVVLHDEPDRFRELRQWPTMGRERVFDPIVIVDQSGRLLMSETTRIDSFTKIEIGAGVTLGARVHVASFCHLNIGGGYLILEPGAACGSGARLITGSNVYGDGRSCSAVSPDAVFSRSFVRVCRNAVVFAGATVLPGVTIGENAVVGAGALVRDDVPPFEVWAGNPARRVKVIERKRGDDGNKDTDKD
jgi:galactoside O-acetyltransferase